MKKRRVFQKLILRQNPLTTCIVTLLGRGGSAENADRHFFMEIFVFATPGHRKEWKPGGLGFLLSFVQCQ